MISLFRELPVRWIVFLGLLIGVCGCSVLDRQGEPEILDLRADQGPSVGRGRKVNITIVTDDPDNDELDFRWIASGGVFTSNQQDTLTDLFQDSVTVSWQAPIEVGIYELFLEVSDGLSEEVVSSSLQIEVTQSPPVAQVVPDLELAYTDTLLVVLDGTGSSDPDGDDLSYFWRQIAGPTVALVDDLPDPSFPAIAPADYIFELSVADDKVAGGDTSAVVILKVRVTDRGGRDP